MSSNNKIHQRLFEKHYFYWIVITAPVFLLVTGAFLQKFTLMAGINKFYIGISLGAMSLIPALVSYFLTSIIEQRQLRYLVFVIAYILRFALVSLLALLPFFFTGQLTMLSISYVIVMMMIAFCYTFGNICSEALIKEAIPKYRFGQFAAKLAAISCLVGIIPTIICAFCADYFKGMLTLQIILITGSVVGVLLTLPLLRGKDFSKPSQHVKSSLLAPMKDRHFRKFIIFFAIQSFFITGSIAFWAFFFLEELKISLFSMIIIGSCTQLFTPVFSWIWGIINDHFSARAAYIFSNLFTWLACCILIVPIPPMYCAVIFSFFVGFYGGSGFFSRGRVLAIVTMRNSMIPEKQTTVYIGLFQLVVGIMGFLSGILTGYVLQCLGDNTFYGLTPYKTVFLFGNIIFGLLTTFLFLFVKEHYQNNVNLKKLGLALINPTVFKDFYSIAMINYSDSMDALERMVKRLSSRSTYIGKTELLRNFQSSSVRIKRQAVKGLGFIDEPEILEVLKDEVMNSSSPIVIECIDAIENLKAESLILELFDAYRSFTQEVRMRLVIAAININSVSLYNALESILPMENEANISSEIILGLSSRGKWLTGISAFDRLCDKQLTKDQYSKLWFAIAKLLSRSINERNFITTEFREPGAALIKQKNNLSHEILKSYLDQDINIFRHLAKSYILDNEEKMLAGYSVSAKDKKDFSFLVDNIILCGQSSENKYAVCVIIILLLEIENFKEQ